MSNNTFVFPLVFFNSLQWKTSSRSSACAALFFCIPPEHNASPLRNGETHVLQVAGGESAQAHLNDVFHLGDTLALDIEVGLEVRLDGEQKLQLRNPGEQDDAVHADAKAHQVERADNECDRLDTEQDRMESLAHHVQESADAKGAAPGDVLTEAELQGDRAHANLVSGIQDAVDDAAKVWELASKLDLAQQLPHDLSMLVLHPPPLLHEAGLRNAR
eukprot:747421-Hanusia_phi.AAC.7